MAEALKRGGHPLTPPFSRIPTFCRVGHGEAGRQRGCPGGNNGTSSKGLGSGMQGGYSWGLSVAPRAKDPKAHMALPTPHRAPRQQWAEAGFTVRYLLALITRVGGHGLPTQGLERR